MSNIRPEGRADGHKVHLYSNDGLLAFWGSTCGKIRIVISLRSYRPFAERQPLCGLGVTQVS
ncbi:MAG: hypothetical protein J5529_08895 [Prevotella sp.]|nr:hypothetical protein [Prevotella sp.]